MAKKVSAPKSKEKAKVAKPATKAAPKAVKPAAKVAKPAAIKKPAAKAVPAAAIEKPAKAAKPVKVVAAVAEPKPTKISEPKPKKEVKVKKTKAEVASEKQLTEDVQKWGDYKMKYGHEKAPSYSMSGVFEPKTSLQHKVLGWGYILSVQNDRLEVLFETGPKILISNYKPA